MSGPRGLGGGLSGGNLPPALQQQLAALANQSGGRADAAQLMASLGGAGLGPLVEGHLKNLMGKPSGFIEELPTKIQGRIEYLRQLQDKHADVEEQFQEELAALRAKFLTLFEPLYVKRRAVVTGAEEPPAVTTSEELSTEQDDQADVPAGIPEFWLNVLRANSVIQAKLTEKDEEILQYLEDISAAPLTPHSAPTASKPSEEDDTADAAKQEKKQRGFTITLTFRENPFLSNRTLTKSYYMVDEEEPILERAEGTSIQWSAGKDPTRKLVRKKAKGRGGKGGGQAAMKYEPVESFFNFFSPPAVPQGDEEPDDEAMEALQAAMEEDYEIGDIIRSKLVPKAVSWYTGEEAEDSDEEYEDDDEEEDDDDDEIEDEDDDDDDDDEEAEKDAEGVELIKPKSRSKANGAGLPKGKQGEAGEQQPPECKQQ
ncbi:hypothetical protein WJX74_005210 [Apatococcus lobatus]|uniref:Nucleosome assembly protein n=1 Tax=Apatococcus lobatus TaxID=904363 RepID=A0AAW1RKQ7_9CHLO